MSKHTVRCFNQLYFIKICLIVIYIVHVTCSVLAKIKEVDNPGSSFLNVLTFYDKKRKHNEL